MAPSLTPYTRHEYQESSWEVERCRRVRLTIAPPYENGLSRKCEIIDVSKLYGPPRPITGIDFTYLLIKIIYIRKFLFI
jgi:hypothetical protein